MKHIIPRPDLNRRALADAGVRNGWPTAEDRRRLPHVVQLSRLTPDLLGYRQFRKVYWGVLNALAVIALDHLIEAHYVDHQKRGYRVSLPSDEAARQLRLEYVRILRRAP